MQSLWTEEYDFFLKKKIIAAKHHLITESLIRYTRMHRSVISNETKHIQRPPYYRVPIPLWGVILTKKKKKEMSWLHGK